MNSSRNLLVTIIPSLQILLNGGPDPREHSSKWPRQDSNLHELLNSPGFKPDMSTNSITWPFLTIYVSDAILIELYTPARFDITTAYNHDQLLNYNECPLGYCRQHVAYLSLFAVHLSLSGCSTTTFIKQLGTIRQRRRVSTNHNLTRLTSKNTKTIPTSRMPLSQNSMLVGVVIDYWYHGILLYHLNT